MKLLHHWRKWPYKHTTALVIFIALFVLLLDSALMAAFFEINKSLGYIGAFIAGILFVSLFTSGAAVVILFELARVHNIWWVTLAAALGTIVGDFLILRLFEDKLVAEFRLIVRKMNGQKLLSNLKRRKYRSLEIIIGLAIIGSPLPDEIGLGILDISHLGKFKILFICFFANLVGIFTITLAAYLTLT